MAGARGTLGRGLPLQRIGLRLQIVCETSQAAPELIVRQQLTGKLTRMVCLSTKLRRGLTRGRFVRHDGRMPTSNEPTIGRFQRNGIGMPGRAGRVDPALIHESRGAD